jgi:hypothetical protein
MERNEVEEGVAECMGRVVGALRLEDGNERLKAQTILYV